MDDKEKDDVIAVVILIATLIGLWYFLIHWIQSILP